jgi:ring-1,2-phenylacetyl-CoA epoxidase subunit PaaC
MDRHEALLKYVLRLGDTALVFAQRLIENVTRGPELEEELANANFSLDYLGQARMFYTYAGELEGRGRDEDDFALLRPDREFANYLLVEQPNGHFGDMTVRAVLFETFYLYQLEALCLCTDQRLAAIAARAVKELRYHHRYVCQWLVRLGDGTAESHERVQESLHDLWKYTGELFAADDIDSTVHKEFAGPDCEELRERWRAAVTAVVCEATLELPDDGWMASGGRDGRHSEEFGFLVTEMQSLHRAYPGLDW